MRYALQFRPSAIRDLKKLSPEVANRILSRIESLGEELGGDVKRLTHAETGFRLRVGDYRVLFDLVDDDIILRWIRHRREAYRK